MSSCVSGETTRAQLRFSRIAHSHRASCRAQMATLVRTQSPPRMRPDAYEGTYEDYDPTGRFRTHPEEYDEGGRWVPVSWVPVSGSSDPAMVSESSAFASSQSRSLPWEPRMDVEAGTPGPGQYTSATKRGGSGASAAFSSGSARFEPTTVACPEFYHSTTGSSPPQQTSPHSPSAAFSSGSARFAAADTLSPRGGV